MRSLAAAVVLTFMAALGSSTNSARSLSEQTTPVPTAAACAAPTLGAGIPSSVGDEPRALVVADFNGDGILDLATANREGNSVSVVPGGPGGTLGAATTIAVGASPTDLSTADFNTDGRPDLAVVHQDAFVVSVLLNSGTGEFQLLNLSVSWQMRSIVTADFTGDGHADVVVAGEAYLPGGGFAGVITLLPGDGAGAFGAPRNFSTVLTPLALAASDFTGDGRLDLAVTSTPTVGTPPGSVAILIADGSGGFGAPTVFAVGRAPSSVAIGDFNVDSRADLVVSNQVDRTVSVLLGDGAGGFAPQHVVPVGGAPSGVIVADANLDGWPDSAVTNLVSVAGPDRDVPVGVVQIVPGDGAGGLRFAHDDLRGR